MTDKPPDHLARALALIPAEVPVAIADLSRMIAVDTSFPPGAGYAAFADLMEEHLGALGFLCHRVDVPARLWQTPGGASHGDRVNLIAERRSDKPVCGLYYHVDTVPAVVDWKRPPLALTRKKSPWRQMPGYWSK